MCDFFVNSSNINQMASKFLSLKLSLVRLFEIMINNNTVIEKKQFLFFSSSFVVAQKCLFFT